MPSFFNLRSRLSGDYSSPRRPSTPRHIPGYNYLTPHHSHRNSVQSTHSRHKSHHESHPRHSRQSYQDDLLIHYTCGHSSPGVVSQRVDSVCQACFWNWYEGKQSIFSFLGFGRSKSTKSTKLGRMRYDEDSEEEDRRDRRSRRKMEEDQGDFFGILGGNRPVRREDKYERKRKQKEMEGRFVRGFEEGRERREHRDYGHDCGYRRRDVGAVYF